MNELYWITRLDVICIFLVVLLVLCSLVSIYHIIGFFEVTKEDSDSEQEYQEEHRNHRNKAILFLLLFICIFICRIFTPTTKEALVIYGIGGTIDYVKSNEVSKELPDKCIQAIDKFLNDYIKE